MSVNYTEKIKIFNDERTIDAYSRLETLPDTCPACKYYISPSYILAYEKSNFTIELLCGCPKNDCASIFVAVYKRSPHKMSQSYTFSHLYPYSKAIIKFPQEVVDVSPEFVAIYNQANYAEQRNLDLICGVAYRKALEYLIKDFAIKLQPDKAEEIKSKPLQKCIRYYIDQSDIKEMAERAVWLGNDETHYIRKWEDKDVNDLKNLIDLTVYFISMNLKASKYQEEMLEGKK